MSILYLFFLIFINIYFIYIYIYIYIYIDDESHIMSFMSNQQYLNGQDIVKLSIHMCSNTPSENYSAAISGMNNQIQDKPLVSKYTSASRAHSQTIQPIISNNNKNQKINKNISNKENQSDNSNNTTSTSTLAINMPNTMTNEKLINIANQKRSQNSYFDDAMSSMAQYAGQAIFPLPKNGYPAYSGYPKTIVDWEIKKRESIIAIHKEMHGHAELLSQLRDRVSKAESKHMKWMSNKHAEYDIKHTQEKELMSLEKEELIKLYSMEQEVTRQRIESLAALERISNDEAKLTKQLELAKEG